MNKNDELNAILAEEARRGIIDMPAADLQEIGTPDKKQGWLEKANPYIEKANTIAEDYLHLPEIGAGILQTYADIPISVANTLPRLAGLPTIPHPNFREMLNKEKTLGGDIAHIAGQVTGGIPATGTALGLTDKLGRGAGYGGMGTDALKGALTGFVGGEHGNEGEGRLASAVLGAPAGVLANLTDTAIAKNIGNAFQIAKSKYAKLYNKVLSQAEKEGLSKHLKLPGIFNKKAFKGVADKYTEPLKKAIGSGKLEDVHRAQSKLGQFIRYQDKLRENGNPISEIAYNAAVKQQKALQKTLNDALAKSKNGLGEQYGKITAGYAEDVVPYINNPAVLKYSKGGLTNKDFVKKLKGGGKSGERFRKDLSLLHPEIGVQQFPGKIMKGAKSIPGSDILKYALGTAVGVPAGQWGWGKIFGED